MNIFEMQELSDVSIISKAGGTWVQCLVLMYWVRHKHDLSSMLSFFFAIALVAHSISHMHVSCLHQFYWCHNRSICCHFIRDRS